MLKMSQINHIRDLSECGYPICKIAKKLSIDPKTVKKYIQQDDFSPKPPSIPLRPSILDPFKETIQAWLAADQQNWYKQRHTAMRVFHRLQEEYGYTGSYDVVLRYVRKIRKRPEALARQELVWEPGTAQVDFGEADFFVQGNRTRLKYLTVSFPYSNDGYVQVFGGETAECVCQGLQQIFHYIGAVPPLLIFDNATGVGRRVHQVIHEAKLFGQFRAHYHFRVRYCNPHAGHEKGNVERKVSYTRANLFVPVPDIPDRISYNKTLLDQHQKKADERHYKKNIPIATLFEEDKKAMYPLPGKPFHVCRYEYLKADGYGKICWDGKHFYSTKPENAQKQVLIGIGADTITVFEEDGTILTTHARQYGMVRTDSIDYSTSLACLAQNAGAWFNSGLRGTVPDTLRDYLDQQPKPELRKHLWLLKDLTEQYGLQTAFSAMEHTVRNGSVNVCDATVIAARMTGYGLETPPEPGPPLQVYDAAFLRGGAVDDA